MTDSTEFLLRKQVWFLPVMQNLTKSLKEIDEIYLHYQLKQNRTNFMSCICVLWMLMMFFDAPSEGDVCVLDAEVSNHW